MTKLKTEFKQIKWLPRKETIKQTFYVLVLIVLSTVCVGGFDTLIQTIISSLR